MVQELGSQPAPGQSEGFTKQENCEAHPSAYSKQLRTLLLSQHQQIGGRDWPRADLSPFRR